MKAMVYTQYGPPEVLRLTEVDKPAPKDNEILIKVAATSVQYGDAMVRNMGNLTLADFNMPALLWLPSRLYFGFRKPKKTILGAELSGVVDAVGKDVTRFATGDEVFAYRGQLMGSYCEYLCMPEDGTVATKPANLSFSEAAVIPYGAIMATSLLKKANIEPGQKVLINGASGGIGSAALQVAKNHYGAEVHGVCSTQRLDYVKALGASRAIDYTQEDITQSGETYDLIIDILGRSSFSRCKRSLKPNGTYFLVSFKMKPLLQMLWTKYVGNKRVIATFGSDKAKDILEAKELIEAGQIQPIVHKSFPLEQAAEAHRYYESGEKRGSIAIIVDDNQQPEGE